MRRATVSIRNVTERHCTQHLKEMKSQKKNKHQHQVLEVNKYHLLQPWVKRRNHKRKKDQILIKRLKKILIIKFYTTATL